MTTSSDSLHQQAGSQRRIPAAIYLLALSLFAQGSSEFLIGGILPKIASDLQISLPTAGTLISAFAIGVLVGAPTLAVLVLRLPLRTTLVACQVAFIAAIVFGVLMPGYWPLLASRAISGVAYAGFWAAASVAAIRLVPPDRTARALSVIVSGLSLAMIAGGPLGTMISDHAGWRAGFWAVAAMTTITAIAAFLALPGVDRHDAPPPDLGAELRAMTRPGLWVAYANSALTTGMYMVTFSYLGALLIETSGLPVEWVPAVLSLFGIGAFIGLTIGGRSADRHPYWTMLIGIVGSIVISIGLALLASHLAITIVLVFLLGVTGFLLNPPVLGRAFTIGSDAPTLAGATNVSAFQLGIMLAPLLGGSTIAAGFGLASVGWVGALFGVGALGTTLLDAHLQRRSQSAKPA